MSCYDSFLSVVESLTHGGIANNAAIDVKWVSSDTLTAENIEQELGDVHGILVPGGFGTRGIEGKILAVQYARENNIPFFGICLGLQMAVIEFARHQAGLPDANSTEVDSETPFPVVDRMPDQTSVLLGGTMRLGGYACEVQPDTRLYKAYGKSDIRERHRHRYELNNDYLPKLQEAGLRVSGVNPESGLVEAVELNNHPWFVGVQFHPEFLSRPNNPHPLFRDFVKAAIDHASQA